MGELENFEEFPEMEMENFEEFPEMENFEQLPELDNFEQLPELDNFEQLPELDNFEEFPVKEDYPVQKENPAIKQKKEFVNGRGSRLILKEQGFGAESSKVVGKLAVESETREKFSDFGGDSRSSNIEVGSGRRQLYW